MNDTDLAKNILLDKTCETCGYLKIINKLILCTKGPNDKQTIPTNSCYGWIKKINPVNFSDINTLLQQLSDSLGVPKEYLGGKKSNS